MVDKLEREPNFDSELFNDPIKLLETIRKFMTITADTEWEYFGLWQAMSKMVNCRQKEKEAILLYQRYCDKFGKQMQATPLKQQQPNMPTSPLSPESPALSAQLAAPPPSTPPVLPNIEEYDKGEYKGDQPTGDILLRLISQPVVETE